MERLQVFGRSCLAFEGSFSSGLPVSGLPISGLLKCTVQPISMYWNYKFLGYCQNFEWLTKVS